MDETISVIVTVYNVAEVLEQTLSCIGNQTYRNLEIILVDDGSTDNSGIICDTFAKTDNRCKVIHKENGGQSDAKNAGQAVATGDYFIFPDADDLLNLDMFRILYEAILRDPTCDIAIAGMKQTRERYLDVNPPYSPSGGFNTLTLSRDDLIAGLFAKSDDKFVFGWNKLYKRDLLEGLYCKGYSRHEDFDFNYRAFLRVRNAVFVDVPLYYWVRREGSKTHQSNTKDLYFDCRTALLYDNWKNLTQEASHYEHYLLDSLYVAMVLWEEWSRKSGTISEVKAQCNHYKKLTERHYITCKSISFWKRSLCVVMLALPAFAHVMMRMTNNAR